MYTFKYSRAALFYVLLFVLTVSILADRPRRKSSVRTKDSDLTVNPRKSREVEYRQYRKINRYRNRSRQEPSFSATGWNGRIFSKRRGRKQRDSASISALQGILRIRVVGTGDACLQTIHQKNRSYYQQFGDSTDAWAFIDLYGVGHCEEGAVGRAFGMVKAWVVAEAYEIGEECLTSVISNVLARTHDPDPNDGVSVNVGGIAEGEALAACINVDFMSII